MIWNLLSIAAIIAVFLFVKFGMKYTGPSGGEPSPSVLNHIRQWAEAYWWIPISLLGVVLFSKFSFFLTQRKPLDNGFDWPGLGQKFFACVLLILLLSIRKEASGVWLTKQEQMSNPQLAWKEAAVQVVMALIFAYIMTHA